MKTLIGTPDPEPEPETVYVITELGSSSNTGFLVGATLTPAITNPMPHFTMTSTGTFYQNVTWS